MRKIIISEHQLDVLRKLIKEGGPLLNNGSTKEYGDLSTISTSVPVDNAKGEPIPGEDVYTDEIGKTLTPQNTYGNSLRRRGANY